jgi:hypothetical protein
MSETLNDVHVKRIGWQNISSVVREVNVELWEALDPVMTQLKKQKRLPDFIVAEYPYGTLLVDEGQFQLPCDDSASTCSPLCEEIAAELDYSYIPLGLILDKSIEAFAMREGGYSAAKMRLVPLHVLSKGELFGVFETLDRMTSIRNSKPNWSVSAGARSVILLAPLNNQGILNKIKAHFSCNVPREADRRDWEVIQSVMQKFPEINWRVQVLLFPKWVIEDDALLAPLQKIFFGTGWQQLAPLRDYVIDEADIAKTYMHHNHTGHASELYYYFTVRHILAISKGEMPAFCPVTSAQSQAGPFLEFQEIMNSINVLKYYPVILQPTQLSEPGAFGYYSVNLPSLLSPVPEKFPQKTRKALVDEIEMVLARLPQKAHVDANLDLAGTRFYSDWGQYTFKNNERAPVIKDTKELRRQGSRLRFLEALNERKGEFLPPDFAGSPAVDGDQKIYFNHKFFDGAVRIVRK